MVHSYYNTWSLDSCRQDLWLAFHSKSSLAAFDGECGVSHKEGVLARLLLPFCLKDVVSLTVGLFSLITESVQFYTHPTFKSSEPYMNLFRRASSEYGLPLLRRPPSPLDLLLEPSNRLLRPPWMHYRFDYKPAICWMASIEVCGTMGIIN